MSIDELSDVAQYLTFTLGEEQFALHIVKVREVLDYTNITKVPRMPDYLRGVINLRGNVVPVVDLRLKLGMTAIKKTVDTCIVIVEIAIDGELMQVGALADSVQEVIDLDPTQISLPPKIGTRINTDFIRGMGRQDDRFLIILDIDRVLTEEDLDLVQKSADDMDLDLESSEHENMIMNRQTVLQREIHETHSPSM